MHVDDVQKWFLFTVLEPSMWNIPERETDCGPCLCTLALQATQGAGQWRIRLSVTASVVAFWKAAADCPQ